MDFLLGVLIFFFIIAALLIILLVLFRPSEGGGLAGAFGGMGSDNVFGVRAAAMIDKVIAVIAATFLAIAVAIGVISARIDRAAGEGSFHQPAEQEEEPVAVFFEEE